MSDPSFTHDGALRLTVYDLPAADTLDLSGTGCWFVYAPEGGLTVESEGGTRTVAWDEGVFVERSSRLGGSASAWIFEVAPAASPFLDGAEIVRSEVLRPALPGLLRADRIESPPGAVTPRHGHRGSGMRRLICGRLLAEIGESVDRIEAGQAWFETGSDMVVGTNIGTVNAAFVRVMLLPVELGGGKSSFVAENAVEAAKPRLVNSRLYGEMIVTRADMQSAE